MDTSTLLHISLSFLIGGAWVTMATMAADRFGSKLGGLLTGMPSIIVVMFLFIGLAQGSAAASEATTVVPMSFAINGPYLMVYVWLAGYGPVVALPAALLVWFLLAGGIVLLNIQNFPLSLAVWLTSLVVTYFVFNRFFNIPSQGKQAVRYTKRQLLARGVISGGVVGFTVLMSKIGGPFYGGIFASFPAVYSSTLVITYLSGGAAFSQATAKAMMVSGFINVVGYATAVRYLYLYLDVIPGTLGALAFSATTGYLTLMVMQRKLS